MNTIVRVRGAVLDAITSHAITAWPEECCGLLLGRGDQIEESFLARNTAEDRAHRFLVEPADHFGAIRAARARGLDVIGAYHSHPQGDPIPSATDRGEAFEDPEFIHLIVGRAGIPGSSEQPAVAAYRFVGREVVALRLVRE